MVSYQFRGVEAGEQLGNLEYLIDGRVAADYAELVGGGSQYANLLTDDCHSMTQDRFGDIQLTAIWRGFEFLRPPIHGRRIQVGGWLRDVREKNGQTRLRVATFAVDEIGTEILRSEAIFAVGRPDIQAGEVSDLRCPPTGDCLESGFQSDVGDDVDLGGWRSPAGKGVFEYQRLLDSLASRPRCEGGGNGFGQLMAGWLEGQIGDLWGDDFRWGGRLSLAYRRPIAPGDKFTASAVVVESDRDRSGGRHVRMVLDVRNRRDETAVTGIASASFPSPRLL